MGYLVPVSLAITGGLIVGTNSFLEDDLDRYSSVREAMALGQTIGGLETLGLILVVAATVPWAFITTAVGGAGVDSGSPRKQ